jgi:hypothetical protein
MRPGSTGIRDIACRSGTAISRVGFGRLLEVLPRVPRGVPPRGFRLRFGERCRWKREIEPEYVRRRSSHEAFPEGWLNRVGGACLIERVSSLGNLLHVRGPRLTIPFIIGVGIRLSAFFIPTSRSFALSSRTDSVASSVNEPCRWIALLHRWPSFLEPSGP